MRPRKAKTGKNKYIVIVVTAILAITVMVLAGRFGGSFGPLNTAAAVVAYPFEKSMQFVVNQLSGVNKFISNITVLYADNERLRGENTSLKNQIVSMTEIDSENRRLRKLLEAKKNYGFSHTFTANVIAFSIRPDNQSLFIDAGEQDGIKADMPVVAADGLVGAISEVFPFSARVSLITSPDLSFSATVQRFDARTFVMAQGLTGSNKLIRLENIPQNIEVIKGDRVVTRGLGGLFPKGLPVGEVIDVNNSDGYFRTATVRPAVKVFSLEQVLIVTDYKAPIAGSGLQ